MTTTTTTPIARSAPSSGVSRNSSARPSRQQQQRRARRRRRAEEARGRGRSASGSAARCANLTRARDADVVRPDDPGSSSEEDTGSSRGPPQDRLPGRRHGRPAVGRFSTMKTWTATTTVDAGPEAVLDVLTDPDAVARWAPLPFDVDDLDTPRLVTGSRARVSGRLAGRRVGFDVEVHEAEPQRLSLAAHGPVGLDVAYDLSATEDGSEVHASISVRSRQGHHRPADRRGHRRPALRRRAHPRRLPPRRRGGVPRLTSPKGSHADPHRHGRSRRPPRPPSQRRG